MTQVLLRILHIVTLIANRLFQLISVLSILMAKFIILLIHINSIRLAINLFFFTFSKHSLILASCLLII